MNTYSWMKLTFAGFEALTGVTMKVTIFWDLTSCIPEEEC
jgi:hypothetical protein